MSVSKKTQLIAVLYYISFFLLMVGFNGVLWRLQISSSNPEDIKFVDIFNLVGNLIIFIMLQIIHIHVLKIYSRLDGYTFLSGNNAYIVSRRNFYNEYKSLIKLALFVILFSLLTYVFKVPNDKPSLWDSILWFIVFIGAVISLTMIVHMWIQFRDWIFSFFVGSVSLFGVIVLILNNDEVQNNTLLLVLILVFTLLLSNIAKELYRFRKNNTKFGVFIKNIVFSEFIIAKQSKTNAENISILEDLLKKSSKSDVSDFLDLLKSHEDRIFLKEDKEDEKEDLEGSFLELNKSSDFNQFIINLRQNNQINEKYSNVLADLEREHFKRKGLLSKIAMNSRTENIKLRNKNNLYIGVFIYLFSFILMLCIYNGLISNHIIQIFIWTVFIRLILRTFEIGRAFYNDLTEKRYSKSFLIATERIGLAVKSVIELCFLASAIYLPHVLFLSGMCSFFDLNHFWRVPFYAVAVAVFNFSFPETFSQDTLKSFMWLSVHLIQVISSLILITISITSYMARSNALVYFDFFQVEGEKYKIFKRVHSHPEKDKEILSLNCEEGTMEQEVINERIKNQLIDDYRKGRIGEQDFDYLIDYLSKTSS